MNIVEQLKRDEGFCSSPYIDTRGHRTVGFGHNLDSNPLPDETYPLSVQRATDILAADVARIWGTLKSRLPWVVFLKDVYAGVLTNMAFNMGVDGLMKFEHMLAAVKVMGWEEAANQMVASVWYKQVGERAKRLVEQMRTGVWQ